MTYSRSQPINQNETRRTGSPNSCLSGFLIPPLIVLCLGILLTAGSTKMMPNSTQSLMDISSNGNGNLAGLFTPEIQHWSADITRWSSEHGLDPNMAATVMQIESCGNPDAQSSAGASGLFQVMPFHFLASEDAFNPETNALRGLAYLAKSLQASNGNARLAFAGYNGGIGVIAQSESNWANETIRYAYWGSGIYTDAQQNADISGRLSEWLTAGGSSLCYQARARLGITQ